MTNVIVMLSDGLPAITVSLLRTTFIQVPSNEIHRTCSVAGVVCQDKDGLESGRPSSAQMYGIRFASPSAHSPTEPQALAVAAHLPKFGKSMTASSSHSCLRPIRFCAVRVSTSKFLALCCS